MTLGIVKLTDVSYQNNPELNVMCLFSSKTQTNQQPNNSRVSNKRALCTIMRLLSEVN